MAIGSLCEVCEIADKGCPIYPQQTAACIEFRCYPTRKREAMLLCAGAVRDDNRTAFSVLCALIDAEMPGPGGVSDG